MVLLFCLLCFNILVPGGILQGILNRSMESQIDDLPFNTTLFSKNFYQLDSSNSENKSIYYSLSSNSLYQPESSNNSFQVGSSKNFKSYDDIGFNSVLFNEYLRLHYSSRTGKNNYSRNPIMQPNDRAIGETGAVSGNIGNHTDGPAFNYSMISDYMKLLEERNESNQKLSDILLFLTQLDENLIAYYSYYVKHYMNEKSNENSKVETNAQEDSDAEGGKLLDQQRNLNYFLLMFAYVWAFLHILRNHLEWVLEAEERAQRLEAEEEARRLEEEEQAQGREAEEQARGHEAEEQVQRLGAEEQAQNIHNH